MKMNAVQYTNNVVLKIKLEQDNLLRLHVSEYITKLKQNDVIILKYFDVDKNDYQTIVCKIERLVYEKVLFGKRPVVYCYVCDVKDEANKKKKMKLILLELNMMMQLLSEFIIITIK